VTVPRRPRAIAAGIALALVTLGPILPPLAGFARRVLCGEAVLLTGTPALWGRSLALAGLSALLAAAVGAGQALWMESGVGRLRRAARGLYLLPLLLPPYLTALTWMVLAGREGPAALPMRWLGLGAPTPFGLTGAALVMGLTAAPVVAWLCRGTLAGMESEPVEAALIAGGPARAWRRVILPALWPSALAGAGIAFAFSLAEYGVPALLQWTVSSQEVYAEFSRSGDAALAAGFALPALLPAVAAALVVAASGRLLPARRAGAGPPFDTGSLSAPPALRAWAVGGALLGAASLLLPFGVLFARVAAEPAGLAEVVQARGALGGSLVWAATAGLGATLAAALLAAALRHAGGRTVAALCLAPMAVPAPLYGLGLQSLASRPGLSFLGDGPLLLVLGHGGRFLPVALLVLLDGWRRQDPLQWEAAWVAPVPRWRRFSRVALPLLLPSLAAAVGLTAALALGEIGAALLLVPPGGQTVALRLYNLLHYGADARVAALALATALSAGVAGAGVWAIVRRGRS